MHNSSGIVPSYDLCIAAMNAHVYWGRVDLILEIITEMKASYFFEVKRCPNIDISFMDWCLLPISYHFTYQGVLSSCLRKKKREEALYLREN